MALKILLYLLGFKPGFWQNFDHESDPTGRKGGGGGGGGGADSYVRCHIETGLWGEN